jgi:hypothetical protein
MAKKPPPPPEPSSSGRFATFVLLAILAAAAAAIARARFIQVVSLKNGEMLLSRYPLKEERWDHPRLQLLRRREKLDQVVAAGRTQLEKIVLLRKWAHDQWKESTTFYYPPWDAVEILDLARKERNYGFCAQYAIVFLQAARSLGLHARYVDLGHFLTAVWSDEHDKWLIMDPNNDWHYERDGRPMKGIELNRASWAKNPGIIYKVDSKGGRTPVTEQELSLFRNYSIILRNDQLSEPETISVNGKVHKLVHEADFHKYPVLGRDQIGYGDMFLAWRAEGVDNPPTTKLTSDDPDDFRMIYNQTLIYVGTSNPEKGLLKLKLVAEQTPDFATFQFRTPQTDWADCNADVAWLLMPGINGMSARVKTTNGWTGPPAELKVFYKKNWLGI